MTDLRNTYARIAGEDGPTEGELVEAIQTLGAALGKVARAVEVAGRDEDVRRHLLAAVGYVGEAANTFLSEMASQGESHASEEATG